MMIMGSFLNVKLLFIILSKILSVNTKVNRGHFVFFSSPSFNSIHPLLNVENHHDIRRKTNYKFSRITCKKISFFLPIINILYLR